MSAPPSLALRGIADGSAIVASDHRNNYADIQTTVNALVVLATAPIGTELAYTEFTSPVATGAGQTEAAALTVVSAGALTFDGSTKVKVQFWCPGLSLAGTTTTAGLNLWDSTDQGRLFDTASASVGGSFPCYLERELTPSAGSHTFVVKIWSNSGVNFIATAGAGGAGTRLPGFIRIVKA